MRSFNSVLWLLIISAPLILAQQASSRCSYMLAIPRPPRPDDLPEIEWSGGWSDRPFIPAPDRQDLCMDVYEESSATSGTQVIFLEEEIQEPVPIAKLNYEGAETPYIVTPLMFGSFNLLGPEIVKQEDHWYIYINNRQDFESPGMQQYVFQVRIDGIAFTGIISLQIVNIDDNDPIVYVIDTCQLPELGEPRLTDCIYEVHDADGQISTTAMTFEITSDRNDSEFFEMQGQNRDDTWFIMDMTVRLKQPLNFIDSALHIFQVTASDSAFNSHTVTMMVQVQNVEHRPPQWVEIFAVQQFNEKTEMSYIVRAVDGDPGIRKPIHYRLETAPEDTFFSIETLPGGYDGGNLTIQPIDRDELQRSLFQFKIIAYKPNNPSLMTEAEVAIIVNDVNDQSPEPLHSDYTVNIAEETLLTLDFDKEFGFHDKDEGSNAQYEVRIEGVFPPGVENAFYIAPQIGYQRQTFIMGTTNQTMLDYEIEDFQNITLRVVATDLDRRDLTGVAIVNVNLINWNDEDPIFEESNQVITFKETEGSGFFVTRALATDRDIGDVVEHSLMGNAVNFLRINISTGDIYVNADNVFDYHRQNQFFVQVRADDTLMEPYHTTTSQLTIMLEDVNNTPPTLRLPRDNPQVEENVPEGYEISNKEQFIITAFDPDTTANLQFEIHWDSSYATKQGRQTDPREFRECVQIFTEYDSADSKGSATAILAVKELRERVTIDFEMFEVLYVTIRVRDLATVDGIAYDESTLTITIIDMNDNAPEFVEDTVTQQLRVRERSATGTIIGSVTAIDIDGPLYNQVRYTIYPRNDTPADLVNIDFNTGQIRVNLHEAIDADCPPRHNLYYKVVATDRCFTDPSDCPPDTKFWETEKQITIEIIDTNNKEPYPDTEKFSTTVYIYENAQPGEEVVMLHANDLDRDEIYNTVSYQINYAINSRLRDFFAVDRETGRVYVEYTTDEVLDRDGNEPRHRIFFQLFDNFNTLGDGNRNQGETEVLVVLLDINDNAPELPLPDKLTWKISEGLSAGTRLTPLIFAPDIDEPGTDNSRVGYAILNLAVKDRSIEVPDLFKINTIPGEEGELGELETAQNLKGFWGTYDILIHAFDHGDPQQDSQETYTLVIDPYNFHAPEFVFPKEGTLVRLSREWALVGIILRKVNNENLESITATDEDGLNAGVVTFSIVGNAVAEEYFNVVNNDNNMGTLQLSRELTDQTEFHVTIRATDGGTDPGPLSTDTTLHVVFVPTTGNPVFTMDSIIVSFFEKEAGLSESFYLPKATDPKNYLCTDDCHDIYYSIYDGNDIGHFRLDSTENVLSLVTELDREQSTSHTLTIVTSNSPDFAAPVPGAVLVVIVNVREADPRPVFERNLYTAGITTADSVNRELLTVHATHSENDAITYTIEEDSMVVDPTLEAVKDSAFTLDPDTGVLVLNIQPTAAMQGIFEFKVVATDTATKTDTAEVKIYVVSAQNWVYFVFLNTVAQIEANRNFIQQTFTAGFGMTCNIDQVTPFTDSSGIASETRTRLRTHFIQDDIPVTADVVEQIRSDTERIMEIRDLLLSRQVILQDVFTEESPEMTASSTRLMLYLLAGLTTVLGLMLVLLVVAYIIRTRTLNRRLEALSTNKFGSIDSGLNRKGLIAPGTNKHAAEGSNPIWNEALKAPDFDALSDASGDSDLIGIEDLPQFQQDYFPPGDTDSGQNIVDAPIMPLSTTAVPSSSTQQIPNHSNNFGFGTAPFRPNFANNNLFSDS